ncbi:MAG: energy transducer TonB [Opitutaceae bacterium]
MNKIYKTANHKSRVSITVIGGFVATAILFLALPFTQLLNAVKSSGDGVELSDYSMPPPPPPPAEPPPPQEDEEDKDKPELETKPPPLTLAQLEIAINPGDGGASGDFGFGTFTADFNALEELEVFELADLDKIPNPLHRVAPTYPYEMKQAGISGSARVIFIVDENGRVRSPRIDSSTHREFEQPSIDAVLQWKFEPGMKDGRAVKTRMMLPLKFNLNN